MSTNHTLPLQDIRILALEQYGAGPWATMQLADLGADVVKIEDPGHGGDVGRYVPPFQQGEDSLFFEAFNRGKRSMSLDLRSPAGRRAFEAMIPRVDAVFSNLRGDQPKRLGLTYGQLKALNPKLVCCSLSGFGMTGPRSAEPAYDYVIQAMAGWMSLTGEPTGPPAKSGLSVVDFAGGYAAALALIAGLWRSHRTGIGCDCDISLLESAMAMLNYVGTWTASAGYAPQRMAHSAHPSIVPFQLMPTADGWMVIACAKPKFWHALCTALERPDLLADERFCDFAARATHRRELVAELEREFGADTTHGWIERLETAGVPCGAVNDVAEALDDPQVHARGDVVDVEHPVFGTVRHIAPALRLSGAQRPLERAPRRGEHTVDVLREVGEMRGDDIDRLSANGAFGTSTMAGAEPSR
jgi:crotonobetainyl-CoA:carnitine CoA-transferase CaiB-like acyl-CoA transferase